MLQTGFFTCEGLVHFTQICNYQLSLNLRTKRSPIFLSNAGRWYKHGNSGIKQHAATYTGFKRINTGRLVFTLPNRQAVAKPSDRVSGDSGHYGASLITVCVHLEVCFLLLLPYRSHGAPV